MPIQSIYSDNKSGGGNRSCTRILFTLLSLTAGILFCGKAQAQISSSTWNQGGIRIGDSTTTCDAAAEGSIRYNDTTNVHQFCNGTAWANLNSGASAALSGITAATGINTIDSLNNAQTWNWSTISTQTALALTASGTTLTSGRILNVTSAATGFTGTMANFDLTGSNASNTGSVVKTSITGTSSTGTPLMVTNLGAGLSMRVNDETGDADTTPFVVSATGNTGIGTASPSAKLHVVGTAIIGNGGESCSASTAGGLRYNGGSACIEFCNGTTWACTSVGACDAAPTVFGFIDVTNATTSTLTASNILSIVGTDSGCVSNIGVSGDGSPQWRLCSNSGCSTEVQTWTSSNLSYAMFGRFLQVRTTSASTSNTTRNVTITVGGTTDIWSVATGATGACGATPTVGQVCSDGTVYAGVSPDGNRAMYVSRCDASMTWDGSACTGTRTLYAWNDGNSNWTPTSVTSFTQGAANTATLITLDSNSVAGGTQAHNAAQACADLSVHSQTDWYLPARDELDVIYENLVDASPNDNLPDPIAVGFNVVGLTYYSSSETFSPFAFSQNFSTAAQNAFNKNNTYGVRCARKN